MGKKLKESLVALQRMKMNKRFAVVVGIFLLMCACVGASYFLLFGKYNNEDRWWNIMFIFLPLLGTIIGGWLGIETGKLRGNRDD